MMTDDLNALLDTLHLDSCYVIGWSDGGINGLLLAMRHPDKVKKLAVTGANLWPDTTAVDPWVYNWAMKYNDTLSKMNQTPDVKNQRKLAHLLSYEPHIKAEALKKIQCPTLVIGGDHDVLLPKHTMLIAESIPKSYLWILPNSGHSTPIFYKEQFNNTVYDFFGAYLLHYSRINDSFIQCDFNAYNTKFSNVNHSCCKHKKKFFFPYIPSSSKNSFFFISFSF
jgi:pimeloyl-ACP methyl ester carboxylesterase